MTPPRPVRTVTDPAVLAALAHRTRRRLMDALKLRGAATVGGLAEDLDIAAGNVSHHLKVLHRADLVVEDPALARDRRERWWRLRDAAIRWSNTGFGDSPSTEAIVAAATSQGLERQVELARASLARTEHDTPVARASFSTDAWLMLSESELDALAAEVQEVLTRWRARAPADEPEPESGARAAVFVFARGFPAKP